jgi:hypothetical protein
MNLQYISDSTGKTTGVFIPIKDWNELKSKFKGIEKEEMNVPEWHENIVKERLEEYHKGTLKALDFDNAIDDIEKEL